MTFVENPFQICVDLRLSVVNFLKEFLIHYWRYYKNSEFFLKHLSKQNK